MAAAEGASAVISALPSAELTLQNVRMGLDVTKLIASTGKAIAPFVGTLGDAWSALVGDRVAAWRVRNAAALQSAIFVELGGRGLKLDRSKVPERYALTWFEEATKQDEPEIQALFARLLVRAAEGDRDAADRRHLEILTKFTPRDAEAFRWFFPMDDGKNPSHSEYDLWKKVKTEVGDDAWMSIEHLLVLGVLERRFDIVTKEESFFAADAWTAAAEITATERGMSLNRACKPNIASGDVQPA